MARIAVRGATELRGYEQLDSCRLGCVCELSLRAKSRRAERGDHYLRAPQRLFHRLGFVVVDLDECRTEVD